MKERSERAREPATRKSGEHGFALLTVLLIIALVAATASLALREATTGLAEAGTSKSAEIVYADLNRGMSYVMQQFGQIDPFTLVDPTNRFDIFKSPPDGPFISPNSCAAPCTQVTALNPAVSAASPYAVPITVGLRPGQKTEPPPGEDVRTAYGYILEVQLQADIDTAQSSGTAPAQERVTVGVRIPKVLAHSNN
jgi:hypothetical protein